MATLQVKTQEFGQKDTVVVVLWTPLVSNFYIGCGCHCGRCEQFISKFNTSYISQIFFNCTSHFIIHEKYNNYNQSKAVLPNFTECRDIAVTLINLKLFLN